MDTVQFILILVAFLSYISSLVIANLNSLGLEGLYSNSGIGDIDRKYFQQISPKSIAFGIIWPIIYIWNLAGIIYILVSCCLPVKKSPVKMTPTLVPKMFLVPYSLSFLATIGWLFAFDREILGLSLALLIVAMLSVYVAIGISYKAVTDNSASLETNNKVVLWLMRILVQNGLSTLATWLTVATLINLVDVIVYVDSFEVTTAVLRGNLSATNGSTVGIVVLMAIIITWFIIENFVFEKYCRYTYTIYPVLILALSTLIDKLRGLPDGNQNLIIASVDLGLVLLALISRIALAVGKYSKSELVAKHDFELN